MKLSGAGVLLCLVARFEKASACINGCSGNGLCVQKGDTCACYVGWSGPHCSLRTCPFTVAWADTADGTNSAHYYAECGNKGICDRGTGECQCFEGYEGDGCRRAACPNDCSGHGTCELISELGRMHRDRRYGPGYSFKDISCSSQNAFPAKKSFPANKNFP